MKIVIAIPTINPGGAEKQAALLAVSLNKGYEIHFVSFNGLENCSESILDLLNNAGVQIHYLDGSTLKKCKDFYRLLKDNSIDIAFNYITYCDVVGAIVEKLAGVKCILNGIRNSRLPIPKLIMEWFAHNFIADHTIYNSFSGAEFFERKGLNKKKTIVIPNSFPNISEPRERNNNCVKTIITVGRFEPQKDYETAIKAISELSKKRQDFKFIIIGHGRLELQIKKWVVEYGIMDLTTIYISPNNVQELLRNSDIYVSTSLYEGTSNSIMEAMNWSIPIVATNVGDNSRLIEDGKSGYLTSVGDYSVIAARLENLVENGDIRNNMGLFANSSLKRYSVEHFEFQYNKILQTITSNQMTC